MKEEATDADLRAKYGFRRPKNISQWLGLLDAMVNSIDWQKSQGHWNDKVKTPWKTLVAYQRYQNLAMSLRLLGFEPVPPLNY